MQMKRDSEINFLFSCRKAGVFCTALCQKGKLMHIALHSLLVDIIIFKRIFENWIYFLGNNVS
jgi:hypothetical protein